MLIAQIGQIAYKLELPPAAAIHPVFHVSQLKKVVGEHKEVHQLIPYILEGHEWVTTPEEVLDYQKNPTTGVWEVLISWKGLLPHKAMWENCDDFQKQFPTDKVVLEGGSNVRPPILFTYSRRKKKEKSTVYL